MIDDKQARIERMKWRPYVETKARLLRGSSEVDDKPGDDEDSDQ